MELKCSEKPTRALHVENPNVIQGIVLRVSSPSALLDPKQPQPEPWFQNNQPKGWSTTLFCTFLNRRSHRCLFVSTEEYHLRVIAPGIASLVRTDGDSSDQYLQDFSEKKGKPQRAKSWWNRIWKALDHPVQGPIMEEDWSTARLGNSLYFCIF